jgi:hypothetical protein
MKDINFDDFKVTKALICLRFNKFKSGCVRKLQKKLEKKVQEKKLRSKMQDKMLGLTIDMVF